MWRRPRVRWLLSHTTCLAASASVLAYGLQWLAWMLFPLGVLQPLVMTELMVAVPTINTLQRGGQVRGQRAAIGILAASLTLVLWGLHTSLHRSSAVGLFAVGLIGVLGSFGWLVYRRSASILRSTIWPLA